mmetsp:Transcript_43573/g.42057  ORF Transcript_43573/g.42057 Transcript_43573/m.42057 type:complete len:300 (-) Transcript_43573:540-1439(-)
MGLKDQVHLVVHHDDFPIHQTELLVVVQNGVHVLDPFCVHWPIEDDPPPGAPHILVRTSPEDLPQDPVREVVRNGVEGAIQLREGNGLRIYDVVVDWELAHHRVVLGHVGDGLGKHLIAGGLGPVRGTHQHQPMTTIDHFIQLVQLFNKSFDFLEVHFLHDLLDALVEAAILDFSEFDALEEIFGDPQEERDVMSEELGQIGISDAAEDEDVFSDLLSEFLLEALGGGEDCLDCPHPIVIVVLGGQLLRAESVGGHDLLGQVPALIEAKGVERNLSNHGVVRDHHGHGPEQSFEVVREL